MASVPRLLCLVGSYLDQTLLSQLNAHTTRLSTVLTQLTDDILRSGGRLAYEVEVLRGDTIGLAETLTDTLKDDIVKFVPEGISVEPKDILEEAKDEETQPAATQPPIKQPAPTPSHITSLHTLTLVRSRLEAVINIFGEAMHWTLPPSETSLTSSLISVSAPANDSASPSDLEKRGKDFAAALRSEIADLVTGADDVSAGAEAAQLRIQALRELAGVWKGTAEEKPRVRFVEGLVKLAEEKQREWVVQRQRVGRSGSMKKSEAEGEKPAQKGGGFLDNLQRLRF
ncbi:hypothetical protein M011DRAFT_278529 [Sporormia fimetaria CBS 119925]|uniref:Uncharacterized protein n=1 Tax=Sporormia fimetaria CBS 119925 TaxID=1340428 RepID=A0A6A6VI68_9PLEO|nr:hypothetical protein M011DRAFT_278529 [Sporormia fimetaria CBS 119925]